MHDEHPLGSNPSGNTSLSDLIDLRLGRRRLLQGAAAVGLAGVLAPVASSAGVTHAGAAPLGPTAARSKLGFAEVPTSADDDLVVPPGYEWEAFIPWGTPLFADSPEFAEDASNTAADQALQVGFNHDGMHFFPNARNRSGAGVLVLNHEYTDASQIYTAAGGSITADDAGREKVAKALAAHGVTVVEVRRGPDGRWTYLRGAARNRRVTGTTPMAFSGPVSADHPMLVSTITPSPIGTLNNCAMGHTPWGTYLACEENWNGYFGTTDPAWVATPLEARYGVVPAGFGYNWHVAEARFDLAVNRAELNHFGWVVEIDPDDPASTPVKRTALGRIKHEGATCTTSKRGRVVVYTGDDENGDYLYKFVGEGAWRKHVARGRSPLDLGTLYVAQFDGEGAGTWVPLVHGEGALTVANGWVDQADVLIRTRQAGDAVGATRLHRPEWVSVDEHTKDVYVTLTNGSGNGAPVNGDRDPNPYGHVVRIRERNGDNASLTFGWEIFVLAGDPAYDARVPTDQPVFGSPDGIYVDGRRLVWIETDISNSSQHRADRGYDHIGNNQILVADPDTGEIKRFLTGPRGCEITGITMTPNMTTLFVNVQHPGESTTYWNALFGAPSVAAPSTVSSWPYGGRPRPSTVVIRKADGGVIGT